MQSKNAIGNLINRYKAVLKKCHLLNTFGTIAMPLIMAGALMTTPQFATQASAYTPTLDRYTEAQIKDIMKQEVPSNYSDQAEWNAYVNGLSFTPSSSYTVTPSVTLGDSKYYTTFTKDGITYGVLLKTQNGGTSNSIAGIIPRTTPTYTLEAGTGGEHDFTMTLNGVDTDFSVTFDPSVTEQGRLENLTEDISGAVFINQTFTPTGDGGHARGGALRNESTDGYSISADFFGNAVIGGNSTSGSGGFARGGAVHNDDNDSIINTIIGDFFANSANGGNGTSGNYGRGGAVYNTGTISTIMGDFFGNSATGGNGTGGSGGFGVGGAVYNDGTSIISTIMGDFFANSATGGESTSSNGGTASGGAISNNEGSIITTVIGDFLGNTVTASNSTDGVGGFAVGGAVDNDEGTITTLMGDFFNNSATGGNSTNDNAGNAQGGAVYNSNGTIDTLMGDFFNNSAIGGESASSSGGNAYGGAVYNNDGTITTLMGDFFNNSAIGGESTSSFGGSVYGGAVYNYNNTISKLTGSFLGSSAIGGKGSNGGSVFGGAVNNYYGTIDTLMGDFFGNTAIGGEATGATTSGGVANGGAIYNFGRTINTLMGDFISNSAIGGKNTESKGGNAFGGAVDNYYGTIKTLTGDFIDNSAIGGIGATQGSAYGGAVYNNRGTITLKNSSFINNTATGGGTGASQGDAYGGAVFNTFGTVTFVADDGLTLFEGNTANGVSNAIYNVGSTSIVNFNAGMVTDATTGLTTMGVIDVQDAITGDNSNMGSIYINATNQAAPTNGFVMLDTVADNNLTHYAGHLSFADGTVASNVFSGGNFNTQSNSVLYLDVDLDGKTADSINAAGGAINGVVAFNITTDGSGDVNIFKGTSGITNTTFANAFTNDYKYTATSTGGVVSFTQQTAILPGNSLANAITEANTNKIATFSLTKDGTLDASGGTLTSGNTFSMYGNDYTLDGDGNQIIMVEAGANLVVQGMTFENAYKKNSDPTTITGGAVENYGTIVHMDADFVNNTAEGGGGLLNYAKNDKTVTLGTFTGDFTDNNAISGGGMANVAQSDGTINIDSITGDFTGNNASFRGGGIINASYNGSIIIDAITGDFIGNNAGLSGGGMDNIIENGGTININSITGDFIGNSAIIGGGLFNGAGSTVNLILGSFVNNSATSTFAIAKGGGLYNEGIVGIGAKTGQASVFAGNTTNNDGIIESNAMHNEGTVYLNADAGGFVLIKDDITGDNTNKGTIEINDDSRNKYGLDNSDGLVLLMGTISDNDIILHGGGLSIADGNTHNINSSATLTVNAGTVYMDVDLVNGTADTLTGTPDLVAFNIMSDAANASLIITGTDAHTDFATAFTNDYTYTATSDNGTVSFEQVSGGGLANAIIAANNGELVTFSLTDNYTLTTNHSALKEGNTFSMYGNGYTLDGGTVRDASGDITTKGNQILMVEAGANLVVQGMTFANAYTESSDPTIIIGGAVENYGTIVYMDADFVNNTAVGDGGGGGGLLNYAESGKTVTLTTFSGDFTGNNADSGGGMANFADNGTVKINTITGDFTDNSAFYGGGMANAAESGSIVHINSITGDFTGNSADFSGGAMDNYVDTGSIHIGTIMGDFINNSTTSFYNIVQGGGMANINYSGTITIGTIIGDFTGNTVTSDIIAFGGGLFNDAGSTINLILGSFVNNSAKTTGTNNITFGAGIHNDGIVGIGAKAGQISLFEGNTTNNNGVIESNAMYNEGTVYLNAEAGGLMLIKDGISGKNTNKGIIEINADRSKYGIGNDGPVMLYGTVDGNDLTLNSGSLSLADGKTQEHVTNGSLNTAVGTTLYMDADFGASTLTTDTLSGSSINGTVAYRILSDGVSSGGSNIATAYTNGYKYSYDTSAGAYTQTTLTQNDGFIAALRAADTRTFSLIGDLTVHTTAEMLDAGTLTIFGKAGSTLSLTSGVGIDNTQAELNIIDLNMESSASDAAISNKGIATIYNSAFTTTGTGNIINNEGELLIVDTSFTGNASASSALISTTESIAFVTTANTTMTFNGNGTGGGEAIAVNAAGKTLSFKMLGDGDFKMQGNMVGTDPYAVNIEGNMAANNIFFLNAAMTNAGAVNVDDATLLLNSNAAIEAQSLTLNKGSALQADANVSITGAVNIEKNASLVVTNGILDLTGAELSVHEDAESFDTAQNGTLKVNIDSLGTFSNGDFVADGSIQKQLKNDGTLVVDGDGVLSKIGSLIMAQDADFMAQYTGGTVTFENLDANSLYSLNTVPKNANLDEAIMAGDLTNNSIIFSHLVANTEEFEGGVEDKNSTIAANASLTLTGKDSSTLLAADLSLENNGTLILGSAGVDASINGTMTSTGTVTINGNATFTANATFNAASGTGGTLTVNSGAGLTVQDGILDIIGGTLTVVAGAKTFATGSSGTLEVKGADFGTFSADGSFSPSANFTKELENDGHLYLDGVNLGTITEEAYEQLLASITTATSMGSVQFGTTMVDKVYSLTNIFGGFAADTAVQVGTLADPKAVRLSHLIADDNGNTASEIESGAKLTITGSVSDILSVGTITNYGELILGTDTLAQGSIQGNIITEAGGETTALTALSVNDIITNGGTALFNKGVTAVNVEFTAGTTTFEDSLSVSGTAELGGTSVYNGTVDFMGTVQSSGSSTFNATVTFHDSLTLSGGVMTLKDAGTITGATTVNNASLVLDAMDKTISADDVSVTANGALTVMAGTLDVSGGDLTVADGATFATQNDGVLIAEGADFGTFGKDGTVTKVIGQTLENNGELILTGLESVFTDGMSRSVKAQLKSTLISAGLVSGSGTVSYQNIDLMGLYSLTWVDEADSFQNAEQNIMAGDLTGARIVNAAGIVQNTDVDDPALTVSSIAAESTLNLSGKNANHVLLDQGSLTNNGTLNLGEIDAAYVSNFSGDLSTGGGSVTTVLSSVNFGSNLEVAGTFNANGAMVSIATGKEFDVLSGGALAIHAGILDASLGTMKIAYGATFEVAKGASLTITATNLGDIHQDGTFTNEADEIVVPNSGKGAIDLVNVGFNEMTYDNYKTLLSNTEHIWGEGTLGLANVTLTGLENETLDTLVDGTKTNQGVAAGTGEVGSDTNVSVGKITGTPTATGDIEIKSGGDLSITGTGVSGEALTEDGVGINNNGNSLFTGPGTVGGDVTNTGNGSYSAAGTTVKGDITAENGDVTFEGGANSTDNITFGGSGDLIIKNGAVVDAGDVSMDTGDVIIGDELSKGTASFNNLNLNGQDMVLDPAWIVGQAYQDAFTASAAAIKAFGTAGIDGNITVGRNAQVAMGTANAAQLASDINAMGEVWGSAGITAALGLYAPQTLANGGSVVVDGTLTAAAGSAFADTATFATNSLLVVDGNTMFDSTGKAAAALTGHSGATLSVGDDAKLHIIGGTDGQVLTITDGFGSGTLADGTTSWGGDGSGAVSGNLTFGSTAMQASDIMWDATGGEYVVTLKLNFDRNTYSPWVQEETADYLDKMVSTAGVGINVNAAKAGHRFLSRAISNSAPYYMGANNPKSAVQTIESAAQMAAIGNVASAAMGAANSMGNALVLRNSGVGMNTVDGQGSGSVTLNNGEITAEKGENGGNMADKAGIGIWLTPLYKWSSGHGFEGGNFEHDYDMGLGGIALGVDFTNGIDRETALRFGLAFNVGAGYSDSTGDFNETNNNFDFWGLSAYGAFQKENFVATLDFGFSSTYNDVTQDLPSSMGMSDLEADVDAFVFTAGLNLEYTFKTDMMNITPHAGVRHMSVTTYGYDIESGSSRVASVEEDTQSVWYFPVGVTLSTDIQSNNGWTFTPKLDLGFIAAAGDLEVTGNTRFTGVPGNMELTMDNVDSFAFNGGLGFELSNEENGVSIGLNYNLQAGEKETGHMIFANFRYEF